MKKVKVTKDDGNSYMLIIYPFNDKNATFGFNLQKSELYQLYLDLNNIFNDNSDIEENNED